MTTLTNIEILNYFYKEYVGEELINPYTSLTDMKTQHPFQVIDLRFQIDHNMSKKIQLFEENRDDTKNAKLCLISIRHREIKMVSARDKIGENKNFQIDNT